MKRMILGLSCLLAVTAMAGNYEVSSPNGKVKVTVNTDESVMWSIDYDGRQVLLPSAIDIQTVQGKKAQGLGKVGKVAKQSVNSSFKNPFYKKLTIADEYGQLLLYTTQKFTIEVRAYNDGAAYRLISTNKKPFLVSDETAEFRFADDYQAFVPYVRIIVVGSAIAIRLNLTMMRPRCRRCTRIRWPSPHWPSVCLMV